MLKVHNAKQFIRSLERQIDAMERHCEQVFRGYVTAVFHRLVMETPQFSGNAVANWNVSVGSPDFSVNLGWKHDYDPSADGPRFSKGATAAAMDAVFSSGDILSGSFSLGSTYYISNAAENLKGQKYIAFLEENPNNFLRPENNPGHMVERTVASAKRGLFTPGQIESLKRLQPGQLTNPGVGI